jgi:hypothetical protein
VAVFRCPPHPLTAAVVPAVPAVATNPLSHTAGAVPHSLTVATPAVANPVGAELYFACTAEHIFGSEVIGPVNVDERLALALTMIELGDDVVDFGRNSRILFKPTSTNKNLFNQVTAKHLEGTGYTCRKSPTAYGNHMKTKMFHNFFKLQQQLHLSKTCIDQKT